MIQTSKLIVRRLVYLGFRIFLLFRYSLFQAGVLGNPQFVCHPSRYRSTNQ